VASTFVVGMDVERKAFFMVRLVVVGVTRFVVA
jgi:hypothetical protein